MAAIMRLTTVLCLILGFATISARNSTPIPALVLAVGMGSGLGTIAARRRHGSAGKKLQVFVCFSLGFVALALYMCLVVQLPNAYPDSSHPWSGVGLLFDLFWAAVAFPGAVLLGIWLVRSWLWSVYDVRIQRDLADN